MPKYKNQLKRMGIIDQMISSRCYHDMPKIKERVEEALNGLAGLNTISKYVIQKDIRYMKECLDAPIKYSRSHQGYYYSDQKYSLGDKIIELWSQYINFKTTK